MTKQASSEKSDQHTHRPSLIRIFTLRMWKAKDLCHPLRKQQADQNLRGAQSANSRSCSVSIFVRELEKIR